MLCPLSLAWLPPLLLKRNFWMNSQQGRTLVEKNVIKRKHFLEAEQVGIYLQTLVRPTIQSFHQFYCHEMQTRWPGVALLYLFVSLQVPINLIKTHLRALGNGCGCRLGIPVPAQVRFKWFQARHFTEGNLKQSKWSAGYILQ